jgi:hypothetical protein
MRGVQSIQAPSYFILITKQTNKLRGLSPRANRHLSAKLVPTFADKGVSRSQRSGSRTDVISIFYTWSRYVFFQLYSRGWVDPVPETPLIRISCSAGNRTRTSHSFNSILTKLLIAVNKKWQNSYELRHIKRSVTIYADHIYLSMTNVWAKHVF